MTSTTFPRMDLVSMYPLMPDGPFLFFRRFALNAPGTPHFSKINLLSEASKEEGSALKRCNPLFFSKTLYTILFFCFSFPIDSLCKYPTHVFKNQLLQILIYSPQLSKIITSILAIHFTANFPFHSQIYHFC